MSKTQVRTLCRTALLLALCVASQFLKNLSPYITGPVINCILAVAALSCGFWSGAVLSVVTPLTSWLITGSPIMSAYPAIVPAIMAGNLIYMTFVWFAGSRVAEKLPQAERLHWSDGRFRIVLLVGAVAAAFWASICVCLVLQYNDIAALFGMGRSSLSLVIVLTVLGCYLLFACFWMLVSRFPRTWLLIFGMVSGAVLKAVFLWLVVVRAVLPAAGEAAKLPEKALSVARTTFSVTQLITALLGSLLAFLIWLPLQKLLKKKED